MNCQRSLQAFLWQFSVINYCLVVPVEDLVSDLSDEVESLALPVDFVSAAAPEADESLALPVDFISPEAPDEDESFPAPGDFISPEAPDEDESFPVLGDCIAPELPGEDELSVPWVPLGVSVLVVPPVVVPDLSPEEFAPPEQAPRINASPNTSEKAVIFRPTMIPPKIFKIFCTERELLTLFWSNSGSETLSNLSEWRLHPYEPSVFSTLL